MIRAGAADDVESVLAIEVAAFGVDAWSRESVVAAVPDLLVAGPGVGGPGVCGYAVLSVGGDVADLHRIAVAAAGRRTGVGRALLAAALDRARDAGAERVLLEVAESNEVARAFYAATGFVEISRRRRYYRDGADALVLASTIS